MSAVLEINLSHLTHNYKYLRSKIGSSTKFLAVVKAFAYGSESVAIAKHLEQLGVDYFGVAYAEEGVTLRENGIKTPILVLHAQPENYESIIKYQLEPNLYSIRTLELFSNLCIQKNSYDYPVHIKFNSGLNRLGISWNDIPNTLNFINKGKLKVASIFSHLAASEDVEETSFSEQQINKFEDFQKQFLPQIIQKQSYQPLIHHSNTSGVFNYQNAHFTMVRAGIGLYGFGNDQSFNAHLKPIASLTAKISQIHQLKAGESLGYNRAFIAKQPTITATVTIGHADGIDRIYGNGKGFVWIHHQKAPILGIVCMDMLMVDITHINCKEGDTAIIFDQKYRADTLAEAVGTISYELITGIGPRVKRRIVE